jgi:group II intron maturase
VVSKVSCARDLLSFVDTSAATLLDAGVWSTCPVSAVHRPGTQAAEHPGGCTAGSTPTDGIAKLINPEIRGWMECYGACCISGPVPVLRRIDTYLLRWIMKKYKKHSSWKKASRKLEDAAAAKPRYFAHWA